MNGRAKWMSVVLGCAAVLALSAGSIGQPTDPKTPPSKPPTAMPGKGTPETPKPQTPAKNADQPAGDAAEQEAWMKAGTPGEMHTWLARGVGTWDAVVKMTMPNSPSEESTGTMKIEMVLGGRYQKGHFSGNMMGMDFEGVATTGYNNLTKMFEGTWMDSFSTATMTTKGQMEGDKLVMKGEMIDPVKNQPIKEKQVFSYMGNDKMTAEFFHEENGKEVPVMTITYTRSKADSMPRSDMDKRAIEKRMEEMKKKINDEAKRVTPGK